MMVIALLVLVLCVQGRHFVRIFDLGSAQEHRRTRRSALTGGFLIVSWYWVATLTLYVVEALTIGLLPNVSQTGAALVTLLPEAPATPIITLLMAGLGAIAIVCLRALFIIRELLLYIILYTMPIGIAVMYANIPVISEIARRFAVQFIALAVLPLPVALLLRGYGLLFTGSDTIPLGGRFAEYLVVISMPVVASTYVEDVHVRGATYDPCHQRRRPWGRPRWHCRDGGVRRRATGAAATARWGLRGAAGSVAANRYTQRNDSSEEASTDEQPPDGGVPEYRRKENDPAYY